MRNKKLVLVMAGLATMPAATFISSEAINDAIAGSGTEDVAVSAMVNANCVFPGGSQTDVAFGSYDPTSLTATTANGAVGIKCTKNTTAVLTMGNGLHGTDANVTRKLKGAATSELLNYNLYVDAGLTNIWSTGGSNQNSYASTSAGTTKSFVIYGEIPEGSDVSADDYSDTVVVTANFDVTP